MASYKELVNCDVLDLELSDSDGLINSNPKPGSESFLSCDTLDLYSSSDEDGENNDASAKLLKKKQLDEEFRRLTQSELSSSSSTTGTPGHCCNCDNKPTATQTKCLDKPRNQLSSPQSHNEVVNYENSSTSNAISRTKENTEGLNAANTVELTKTDAILEENLQNRQSAQNVLHGLSDFNDLSHAYDDDNHSDDNEESDAIDVADIESGANSVIDPNDVYIKTEPVDIGSKSKAFEPNVELNWHSSKKPFKCDHCATQFTMKCNFDKHRKNCNWKAEHGNWTLKEIRKRVAEIECELELRNFAVYQCEFCKKILKTKTYLKDHLLVHSKERRHKCPHCKNGFSTRTNLRTHMQSRCKAHPAFLMGETSAGREEVSPGKEVLSPDIGKISSSEKGRRNSARKSNSGRQQHSEIEESELNATNSTKTRRTSNRRKEKSRLSNIQHSTTLDDESESDSDLANASKSKTRKKRVSKTGMNNISNDSTLYTTLLEDTINFKEKRFWGPPYICHICQKETRNKSNLLTHIRTHTNEKPYSCKYCQMRFGQSANRNKHERNSCRERHQDNQIQSPGLDESNYVEALSNGAENSTYLEDVGDNGFDPVTEPEIPNGINVSAGTVSDAINDQTLRLKTDSGEPRNLDISIQSTTSAENAVLPSDSNMINGFRIKEESIEIEGQYPEMCIPPNFREKRFWGPPYICHICQKETRNKANLMVHIRTHTKEKPFSCKFCQMRFSQSANRNKHERKRCSLRPKEMSHLKRDQDQNTLKDVDTELESQENSGDTTQEVQKIVKKKARPQKRKQNSNTKEKLSEDGMALLEKMPKMSVKLDKLDETQLSPTDVEHLESKRAKRLASRDVSYVEMVQHVTSDIESDILGDLSDGSEYIPELPDLEGNENNAENSSVKYNSEEEEDEDEDIEDDIKDASKMSRIQGKNGKFKTEKLRRSDKGKICVSKRWKCTVCFELCNGQKKLRQHMDIHADIYPFKCGECGRRFRSKEHLEDHVNDYHTTSKPRMSMKELEHEKFDENDCKKQTSDFIEEILNECGFDPEDLSLKLALWNNELVNVNVPVNLNDDTKEKFKQVLGLFNQDGKEKWRCTQCTKVYPRRYMVINHIFTHFMTKKERHRFMCEYCGHEMKTRQHYRDHVATHTGERRYQCRFCTRRFVTHTNCKMHEMRVHNLNPMQFKCKLCSRLFRLKKTYDKHMRNFHPEGADERRYKCQYCDERFKWSHSRLVHERKHLNEKPYTCDICDKRFYTGQHMRTHRASHGSEKPYMCDLCGKSFKSNCTLMNHKKVHKEMHIQCEYCGKKFRRKEDYQFHLLKHRGEKPYECDICGEKFARKGNLPRHKAFHDDPTRHECQICRRNFKTKELLEGHAWFHSDGPRFDCPHCDVFLPTKIRLDKHIYNRHNPIRKWSCRWCDARFKGGAEQRGHEMRRHKREYSLAMAQGTGEIPRPSMQPLQEVKDISTTYRKEYKNNDEKMENETTANRYRSANDKDQPFKTESEANDPPQMLPMSSISNGSKGNEIMDLSNSCAEMNPGATANQMLQNGGAQTNSVANSNNIQGMELLQQQQQYMLQQEQRARLSALPVHLGGASFVPSDMGWDRSGYY